MPKLQQLQNWDRDSRIRKLIVPDNPNEVLIECDLSQAEARIVAWKAKDATLKELFRCGKKVHEYVGSIIMEREITKLGTPLEYESSKRVVHLSNYGGSPKRISEVLLEELELVISIAQCRRCQNIYFQNFPQIQNGFHQGIQNELQRNFRVLETPPIGLKRKFYTPYGDELFRKAYAHYGQAPVAYITNNAMNILYYSNSWLKSRIRMQVHDSIIVSVPKTTVDLAVKDVTEAMTYKLNIEGDSLIIPVEAKVGKNYGEMKDYKKGDTSWKS